MLGRDSSEENADPFFLVLFQAKTSRLLYKYRALNRGLLYAIIPDNASEKARKKYWLFRENRVIIFFEYDLIAAFIRRICL